MATLHPTIAATGINYTANAYSYITVTTQIKPNDPTRMFIVIYHPNLKSATPYRDGEITETLAAAWNDFIETYSMVRIPVCQELFIFALQNAIVKGEINHDYVEVHFITKFKDNGKAADWEICRIDGKGRLFNCPSGFCELGQGFLSSVSP
jgi:hypothetical protein